MLTRRTARPVLVVLIVVLAVSGGWFAFGRLWPSRPDILLVVWGASRPDRTSAYRPGADTTPWLRSFAADATLFREAFTPCPWPAPARASLFTGLLPMRHGLLQGARDGIVPGVPRLAETLGEAGYETVAFVAGGSGSSGSGLDAGFERMVPLFGDEGGGARAGDVLDAVEDWLRERRNAPNGSRRPLFVFVHFTDLLLPRRPMPQDLAAAAGGPEVPDAVRGALAVDEQSAVGHSLGIERVDDATLDAMGPVYDASLRSVDRSTGRLVEMLRAEAIGRNALIAIVGDHGELLGEHGQLGHEMSVHDEVLRIPLVLRWPGRFDGGRVETAQVRLQDLHPTLLEAARAPMPPGAGIDALSLLETPLRPRLLHASFHRPTEFLHEARIAFPEAREEAFARFRVSIHAVQEPASARGPLKYEVHERQDGDAPPVIEFERFHDLGADPDEREDLVERGRKGDLADAARLRRMIIR
ncbi:MAG TPA: sulfatase-like hydrolase/transferase [Planctomycetota bacterium]|nr:sulfatase-like hydrolase/transferase [Planctomycetota bacterium]